MRSVIRFFRLLRAPRLCAALVFGLPIAACGTGARAQPTAVTEVPFVGCAADGQTGPLAAPTFVGAVPTGAIPGAARLAHYEGPHIAVLAPRGWHCFELYGSGGEAIVVTPEAHDGKDLLYGKSSVTGPIVQLSHLDGGTSGRFGVARIAARLFPIARTFVQQVIDEGLEPKQDFPFGPFPTDHLTRRSDTVVEFTTPAHSEGIGLTGYAARGDLPISGVVILMPDDDMDLIKLNVRLPLEMGALAKDVIAATERDRGVPRIANPR